MSMPIQGPSTPSSPSTPGTSSGTTAAPSRPQFVDTTSSAPEATTADVNLASLLPSRITIGQYSQAVMMSLVMSKERLQTDDLSVLNANQRLGAALNVADVLAQLRQDFIT